MHGLGLHRLRSRLNRLGSGRSNSSTSEKPELVVTEADCNSNESETTTAMLLSASANNGGPAAALQTDGETEDRPPHEDDQNSKVLMMKSAHNSSLSVPDSCPQPPPSHCFRLVILGSSKVGKTAIAARFLNNKFDDNYTPTIEDFHRKLYRIKGEIYQLDILDTSGNHPFPAMRRLSFLTGDLFVLVYSVDNRESFEEVCRLREQIVETKCGTSTNQISSSGSGGSGRANKKSQSIPMVIVGNKCDRETERTVTPEEVATFVANFQCCAFVETSAKRNLRIDDVFCELFLLGDLPLEMSPSLHKRVQPGFLGLCQATGGRRGLSLRRRLSDAYGTVAPNARRPSIRTDLLILQAKASEPGGSTGSHNRRDFRACVMQ